MRIRARKKIEEVSADVPPENSREREENEVRAIIKMLEDEEKRHDAGEERDDKEKKNKKSKEKDKITESEKAKSGKKKKRTPPTKKQILRELVYLILKIAILAAAILAAFTLMFGLERYTDDTMSPAINEGDLIVYYRLDKNYVAKDNVILKYKDKIQVRRVVATEGDKVDIKEKHLFINDTCQQEAKIYEKTERFDTGIKFPMVLKKGEIFVLGDAREHAADSRVYGAIKAKETYGKVVTIIRRRQI